MSSSDQLPHASSNDGADSSSSAASLSSLASMGSQYDGLDPEESLSRYTSDLALYHRGLLSEAKYLQRKPLGVDGSPKKETGDKNARD